MNGNETIAAKYPDIVIAGPATEVIPAQTMAVHGGDSFHLDAIPVKVLSTPCHTGTTIERVTKKSLITEEYPIS